MVESAFTVAVIAVVEPEPLPTPWPRPLDVPILATEVSPDVQVTAFEVARLRVLPSRNVPIAANPSCVPAAIMAFAGDIAIERRFDRFTVNEAWLLVMLSNDACTVVVPTPFPIARPLPAATNTIEVSFEFQEHEMVMSWVLPSSKLPIAVNCC